LSKYKETLVNEKEIRLDELILSAKRTMDELAPLEAYLNIIKGQIKELMNELNIDEYKSAKLNTGKKKIVRLNDFINFNSDLKKFGLVTVEEQETLSNMYKNNIDYTLAKRILEEGIERSLNKVILDERISIKI
jgi:hypothetical protein